MALAMGQAEVNLAAVRKYLVDTEIKVAGRVLYRTPAVD